MKTKEYFFDGNTYVCRIVQANDGEELIIAPTALLDVIQPGSFEDVSYYGEPINALSEKVQMNDFVKHVQFVGKHIE